MRRALEAAGLGDRVTLPGPVTGAELAELWARTDVLALPSLAETYGMVVLEAFAHGVPVVVARGTGAVEALADGGGPDPGLAVDARSPRALADGLHAVLTRPEFREFARSRRGHLRSWATTASLLAHAATSPPATTTPGRAVATEDTAAPSSAIGCPPTADTSTSGTPPAPEARPEPDAPRPESPR